MMSATSFMRPSATGTNADTGFAASNFSNTCANSGDCHSPGFALGFADAFIAAAKSLTDAANCISSNEYFMGLSFKRELWNSDRSLTGNPTPSPASL